LKKLIEFLNYEGSFIFSVIFV